MITLYRRVEKTKNNLRGIEELNRENNPLLHPTMICLSAQGSYPKSVFGIVREGMRAARLRTSQGVAGKYALNQFPINFVGVKYDYQGSSLGETLAQEYFLPLISKDGQRIDIKQAKKNMRNITIMTYCDGTFAYLDLENKLINMMQELGYSETEIKTILNELALVSVLTMIDTSKCLATSFQLVDVNDNEIYEEATPSLIDSLERQYTSHDFIQTGDNNGIYYFDGSGKHSIKAFFDDDYLPHVMISAIISQCLTRSIDKHHEFSFDNMVEMINSIINHHKVGYTPNEIMADLDDQIIYPGARKLSNYECEYLDIIDELSRKANNLDNDNRLLHQANKKQRENYDKLEVAVRNTVSEVDYIRIFRQVGYQFSSEDLQKLEKAEQSKK